MAICFCASGYAKTVGMVRRKEIERGTPVLQCPSGDKTHTLRVTLPEWQSRQTRTCPHDGLTMTRGIELDSQGQYLASVLTQWLFN